MFGFNRKEKELQELNAKAMELIEVQRKSMQELSAFNERLSRELAETHAHSMHLAKDLIDSKRALISMKAGVVAGAKRAVELLEQHQDTGDESQKSLNKDLLGAFKEILRAASDDHDEQS